MDNLKGDEIPGLKYTSDTCAPVQIPTQSGWFGEIESTSSVLSGLHPSQEARPGNANNQNATLPGSQRSLSPPPWMINSRCSPPADKIVTPRISTSSRPISPIRLCSTPGDYEALKAKYKMIGDDEDDYELYGHIATLHQRAEQILPDLKLDIISSHDDLEKWQLPPKE